MEPICTNPDCKKIVVAEKNEVPHLQKIIKNSTIDSILSEDVYAEHIHQYGSTVIFLEYLEGIELDDKLVDEYSEQGHVFLLPMRGMDLMALKSGKQKYITYKATDHKRVWYKIRIASEKSSIKDKLKKIFH